MHDKERIIQRIREAGPWFQYFEVAPGIFTSGRNNVPFICDQLQIPEDLKGMSVLDVGAHEGGLSFECERRGASPVVAYDLPGSHVSRFAVAKEILGSKVEYVQGTVYKLTPEKVGTFDIVLFPGVLYHLRYPLLACDRLRWVTRTCCLIETHVIDNCVVTPEGVRTLGQIAPLLTPLPICQFYERGELANDPSNWFGPNVASVLAWFRSAGFDIEHLATWGGRAAFRAQVRPGQPPYYEDSYEGWMHGRPEYSLT
jgi:tRNA (mo5U34)-methyltransferase